MTFSQRNYTTEMSVAEQRFLNKFMTLKLATCSKFGIVLIVGMVLLRQYENKVWITLCIIVSGDKFESKFTLSCVSILPSK